jgi:hypothetical protein
MGTSISTTCISTSISNPVAVTILTSSIHAWSRVGVILTPDYLILNRLEEAFAKFMVDRPDS